MNRSDSESARAIVFSFFISSMHVSFDYAPHTVPLLFLFICALHCHKGAYQGASMASWLSHLKLPNLLSPEEYQVVPLIDT